MGRYSCQVIQRINQTGKEHTYTRFYLKAADTTSSDRYLNDLTAKLIDGLYLINPCRSVLIRLPLDPYTLK